MAFKIAFLVVILAIASGLQLKGIPKVDARGDFQCPRMIDCSKVCQGLPYKCVEGKCICGQAKETLVFNSASQLEAGRPEKSCSSDKDCSTITCVSLGRAKCIDGHCVCREMKSTP